MVNTASASAALRAGPSTRSRQTLLSLCSGARGFGSGSGIFTVYRARLTSAMGKLKSGGQPFIEALRGGALVGDGGMGTQLYERGMLFSVNYEELNLSRPEVVRKVHEDFLHAGADFIETNTFGANSLRLARYGIDDRAREINLAAVKIATEAAAGKAYVAGAIGPTGLILEGVEGESARVRA